MKQRIASTSKVTTLREIKTPTTQPVIPKGRCPYIEWYEFVSCSIKTCKNHTEHTERKCIALDRVKPEGAKVISDAEIHLYKLKDLGLKSRIVQIKRKKAVDRVKCLLVLRNFIEYIRNTKESGGVFNTPTILEAEQSYPFKIKKLGWCNWMWEYILDEEVWKEFIGRSQGDLLEYSLQQIVALKPVKFERLVHEFNFPSQKGTQHDARKAKVFNSSSSRKSSGHVIPLVTEQQRGRRNKRPNQYHDPRRQWAS